MTEPAFKTVPNQTEPLAHTEHDTWPIIPPKSARSVWNAEALDYPLEPERRWAPAGFQLWLALVVGGLLGAIATVLWRALA